MICPGAQQAEIQEEKMEQAVSFSMDFGIFCPWSIKADCLLKT